MRQLRDFVGAFAASPLDRGRPLWKAALVEGLQNDRLSLVMKIHHAAMDGGRAAAIAGELLDDAPEGRPFPAPDEPWVPDREPSIPWLASDTLQTLLGKPKRAIAATRRVASAVRARGSAQPQAPPEAAPPEKASLFEAPPTPFNRALTPNRSVGLSDVNLVISNIAGPPIPLFTAGTRLMHLFPLGPVQQGSGLNITVMSVVDRLCFGALACTELVPDVQDIATGFVDEIERLKGCIGRAQM